MEEKASNFSDENFLIKVITYSLTKKNRSSISENNAL